MQEVHVYTSDECARILRATKYLKNRAIPVPWDLLIVISLTTAMRRGGLLNTTWSDIDFDAKTIKVAPKRETDETWEWNIKDTDRRILPLTDEIIHLLAEHQSEQPSGYPYVFIPPK